jgi:hypothetical protein
VVGRNDVGWRPESFLRVVVKVAEMDVGEGQLGAVVGIPLQADAAAGEDFAEMIVVALVPKMTGGGNALHQPALGAAHGGVVVAQARGLRR